MVTLEEKQVQEELCRVDPKLFLDKLYDKEGQYVYYTVRYPADIGLEPLTCVHWRTKHGPLPLSLDIVGVVRRQEGDIREAIRQATVNNALKKEAINTDLMDDIDERLLWMDKSSKRLGLYGPWSNKANLE